VQKVQDQKSWGNKKMVTPTNWQNSVQIQIKTRSRSSNYKHEWSATYREIDWKQLLPAIMQAGTTLEIAALKKKVETTIPLWKEE
jgi:hypothetical protein